MLKANGSTNDLSLDRGANLSITAQLNPGGHTGTEVDWWGIALVNTNWYYLDGSTQWAPFNGILSNCRPVYQGSLFNLPATEVLNTSDLPVGSYTFWFAVDYPMDGVLDLSGTVAYDEVTVTVQ